MPNPALDRIIERLDNDLPRSALFQEKVPALAKAFNADQMKQTLQDVLFASDAGRYSIVNCIPGKALYLPDHIINMQYQLTILDHLNNQTTPAMINARLFQDLSTCKTYLDQILMPIAAKVGDRPELQPFSNLVANIEALGMVLSVYPIDGLIPTLVDATDTQKIASLLAETLPEALSGEFSVREVRLLPAHYGRYKRCVLRYSVEGIQTETQSPQSITVYGKVDADGLGGLTVPIISALREKLHEPDVPYRFRVPHSLGYFPDKQLLLMEALPGKPFFKELLKTWRGNSQDSGGDSASSDGEATLERAVQTCALIAITMHRSEINLGRRTSLEMQVAKLLEGVHVVTQVYPELGAQLKSWIDQTVEFSQDYPALPLCFSHGDFTYTQLIFDGKNGGLVDFDTMGQAEPAQDLGHYLAYQRLNIVKLQDPNAPFAPEAIERLCALFLDTYIEESKGWISDERLFRGRVAIYELISLIRLALHSWEKMKGIRLKHTIPLLEERIECQKRISLAIKNRTT